MTSSINTGERRWGASRRGGMTVLGKVAVPKPINLPSQRLENHGQNKDVEIVPKGTLSWGTKSSNSASNAWGSTSTVTTAESGLLPNHSSARPSSGGSVTRPSTAGSEVTHESAINAWGPNSRPSSASGPMASTHNSNISLRPQSAETSHGTSQLSRFADTAPENSSTWGSGPTDKWGMASSKNDKFSLTSGDFPTLGVEKEPSDRNHRDGSSHGRPDSSGETSENKGPNGESMGDMHCYPGSNTRNENSWRRDGNFYDDSRPGIEKWHNNPHSYPMPPHYDTWHGPPVNNQNAMWYRGPPNRPAFRPPVGPNGFPMEPFPFYRPQMNHRDMHPSMGEMYRPQMHDGYPMPVRPGYYPPCDPYYGPPAMGPMGSQARFPSPNHHDSRNMVGGFNSEHNPPLINKFQDGHRMVLLKQGDVLDGHLLRGPIPAEVNDIKRAEDPQSPKEINLLQKIEGSAAKLRSDNENKREASNVKEADAIEAAPEKGRKPRQSMSRNRHYGKGKLERVENVAALEQTGECLKEAVESTVICQEKDTEMEGDCKHNQRSTMLELAKIRLKQREREEEERSRDQKAKALARLEELNRRTQVDGSSLLGPKPTSKPDKDPPKNHPKDPLLPNKKTASPAEAPKQKTPQEPKPTPAILPVTGNPTVYFGGVPVEITPSVLNVKSKVKGEEKSAPVESKRSKTPEYDLDPASLQPAAEPKVVAQPTEETTSKNVKQMKSHTKKVHRNNHPNRTEKVHANESVVWAPIRPVPPPPPTQEIPESKPPLERQNNPRGKRAEIERYVPKQGNSNNAQELRDEVLPKNGRSFGAWRKRVSHDAVEPPVPDPTVEDGTLSKDQTVVPKGKRHPVRAQKVADSDGGVIEGTKAHWQPKGTNQKGAKAVEPESEKIMTVQKGGLKSNSNYESHTREISHRKGSNYGRRGRQVTNVELID